MCPLRKGFFFCVWGGGRGKKFFDKFIMLDLLAQAVSQLQSVAPLTVAGCARLCWTCSPTSVAPMSGREDSYRGRYLAYLQGANLVLSGHTASSGGGRAQGDQGNGRYRLLICCEGATECYCQLRFPWQRHFSYEHGTHYFWNTRSQRAQWEPPYAVNPAVIGYHVPHHNAYLPSSGACPSSARLPYVNNATMRCNVCGSYAFRIVDVPLPRLNRTSRRLFCDSCLEPPVD